MDYSSNFQAITGWATRRRSPRCQSFSRNKRRYIPTMASIATISCLITLGKVTPVAGAMPKTIRKIYTKPSAAFLGDAYVSLARPFLVNLFEKTHRLGTRFVYPEYSTLGRAWFNAFVVDLSEYILRRSTCADLEEDVLESNSSVDTHRIEDMTGSRWVAGSPLAHTGYQAAEDVPASVRQSKKRSEALKTANGKGGYVRNDGLSSSNHVVELNMLTILRWKEIFEDTFVRVAKQVLPQRVLELVRSMDENQYSALRPFLEHALYKTLTEFYPTLMSPIVSEAILPNYYVAVSCDACPFSLYTSYTFMALVAAGRNGVDALFLADEMMQHYKNDSPYTSPECKAFNVYMTEALSIDSMTLSELVGRTAGAARRSFYNVPDLVKLQRTTLMGTEKESENKDETDSNLSEQAKTQSKAALQHMIEAVAAEYEKQPERTQGSVSRRFIQETYERLKNNNVGEFSTKSPRQSAPETDPLAELILNEKSRALKES